MVWNKERIHDFVKLAERSEALVVLYRESALFYKKLNTLFSMITIVGSYLLGSTGIPFNLLDPEIAKVINIVIQILIIFLGIFGTIHKTLALNEKTAAYEALSMNYAKFSVLIKKELSKDTAEKTDYNVFYEIIVDNELALKKEQLNIPEFIFQRYTKKMGDQALSYADLFLTDVKIADVSVSADKMKNLDKYV
jgi:hypothetical protein